eukprot:TRINITY_DN1503_c0_g1_i1.p1 TRINITY_DN1503_c0_g1~~TRINITY_DN1503_c0_g1_i1.p1  ORF type:complete len:176 (-),score=58.75 TRINITY_DN1503_c0_g1_i1:98-625(-)
MSTSASQTPTNDPQAREHLYKLVNDFRQGLLITRGEHGLRSRPMAFKKATDSDGIWMFSDDRSPKNKEILANSEVNISCQSQDKWISVSGTATILKDRAKVEELFTEDDKLWFPDGKQSPNLTLIHVRPSAAEIWDGSGIMRKVHFMVSAVGHYINEEKFSQKANEIVDNTKIAM